jgi:hypothetical protein
MTDDAARHISREGLAVSRAPRHRLDPYFRTVGISSVE